MFKKSLSEGQAGDNVGLLLRGIQRDDVVRGQVVCKPGSVTPHKKFKGEIYALTKEEGGRHTPFFTNYKPQFFFRTADITGKDAVHEFAHSFAACPCCHNIGFFRTRSGCIWQVSCYNRVCQNDSIGQLLSVQVITLTVSVLNNCCAL